MLAHISNSPQVDMSVHSNFLSRFESNVFLFVFLMLQLVDRRSMIYAYLIFRIVIKKQYVSMHIETIQYIINTHWSIASDEQYITRTS